MLGTKSQCDIAFDGLNFSQIDGHFLCFGGIFTPDLDCPTCQEPFGEGKSLLALAVAEEVQHECCHQGCTKRSPLDQIAQHEKECKWRLITCPGSGADCTAMMAFCKVEDHAKECEECNWPPLESLNGVQTLVFTVNRDNFGHDFGWGTDLIRHEGKLFFCRVFKMNGNFTVDVVMKGSLKECKEFRVKAAILYANSDEDEIEQAVKASFQPRPLKEDNKPGFCLMVPFNLVSEVGKWTREVDNFVYFEIKVVKA